MIKKIMMGAFLSLSAMFPAIAVPYWNWSNTDVTSVAFPSNFNFGAVVHGMILEGNRPQGEWLASKVGIGADYWNLYKKDIQLAKKIGMRRILRIIDWSKIEPVEGQFDELVIQHYADEFEEYHANGISVDVVIKGYEDPSWFINLGAFEKKANIAIFERYCTKLAQALKSKVDRYITFWCPESYAMLAYWNKTHPPFKKDMQLAMNVLAHELEAHVHVYGAIKRIDPNVQIGITKHVVQLEPKYSWDLLAKYAASTANVLTNKTIYDFFTTGKFDVSIMRPARWGGAVKHYRNALAPKSIDFIGINYHSHYQMVGFKRHAFANEPKTEVKTVTVYPEGLYYAIDEVSRKMARKLNIPIIITQHGIATQDDGLRNLHSERSLYAVSQAIKHGNNVQGYYYYGLLDGCDWASYDNHFGIFSVDRNTMERTFKLGASWLVEIAQKHRRMYQ